VTTATASARGRANRTKGAAAERDLVRWLRANGWPGAERAIRTAYRTADRELPDPGDVTGTPGLVWQMKYTARFDQPAFLAACLAETEQQRVDAGADFGLLVQRRTGVTDPGRWFVWLRVIDLYALCRSSKSNTLLTVDPTRAYLGEPPVRMELADLVPLLHAAGYGTPPVEPEAA
jgi:hypothetical protein